jgi:hypothetical protein
MRGTWSFHSMNRRRSCFGEPQPARPFVSQADARCRPCGGSVRSLAVTAKNGSMHLRSSMLPHFGQRAFFC